MKDKENKGLVYDRWSISIVIFVMAILLAIYLITKHKVKYSWIPIAGSVIPLAITAMSPGRIRRNEYEVEIFIKGENDCGFKKGLDYNAIDGVMIPGTSNPPIYKTANGTDIKIDKAGNVKPVGFGTAFINKLDGAGYLNEAPDECWN